MTRSESRRSSAAASARSSRTGVAIQVAGDLREIPQSVHNEMRHFGAGPNVSRLPALFFRVLNSGKADVPISDFFVEGPSGDRIASPTGNLPSDRRLRSRDATVFYTPAEPVARNLMFSGHRGRVKIGFVVQSTGGKRYEKRLVTPNVEDWATAETRMAGPSPRVTHVSR